MFMGCARTRVMLGVSQQLLLEAEESAARRVRTDVLLLQQVLILYMVLGSETANTADRFQLSRF